MILHDNIFTRVASTIKLLFNAKDDQGFNALWYVVSRLHRLYQPLI